MRNLWHLALEVLLPVVLQQTLFDHLRHFNLFMRWLPALGVLLPVVLQQTLSAAKLLVGYEEPVAPCSRSSLYPGSSTSASLFTYSAVMRITRACGLQGGTSGGQKCDIHLTLHVTPTMLGNYHAELQLPSPWLVSWFVMLIFIAQSCTACRPSLVPRPLPDFITQPWRKNREKAWYQYSITDQKWWTRFHNDGNVPTQYAASTSKRSSLSRRFANSNGLCKYQVANEGV